MEVMYIKYTHGIRHSIIKEGGNIVMNDSKIILFEPVKKIEIKKYTPHRSNKKSNLASTIEDKTNEEITTFFFNAIHKNYLSGRRKK